MRVLVLVAHNETPSSHLAPACQRSEDDLAGVKVEQEGLPAEKRGKSATSNVATKWGSYVGDAAPMTAMVRIVIGRSNPRGGYDRSTSEQTS